mgnify:FL=1
MPRVWVIVLTHGGAEQITADCIESLLKQDYGALTVLLVDNASFDGSGARLRDRFPDIEYLNTGGNLGYAGGNNRGMRLALDRGAEFLLVLNNDTIVDATCVSWLVRSAQRQPTKLGAIAPKILYFDDPARIWYAGGDYVGFKILGMHRREGELDDPKEAEGLEPITFATGCCFLMPAAAARAVGFFAEDFFIYAEDVDLSLRMNRAGYSMYYQPAARLYHREPPGPVHATPFQIRLRDRNRRRIARRLGAVDRVKFAVWFFPTRMVRLAQYTMKRDWGRVRALVAGMTEQ